jgi:hypothetical protein
VKEPGRVKKPKLDAIKFVERTLEIPLPGARTVGFVLGRRWSRRWPRILLMIIDF